MKKFSRWFHSRNQKTKVGMVVLATFIGFGAIGGLTTNEKQNTAIAGETQPKSSQASAIDVTEKQKIAVTRTEIETVEEEVPFTTTTTYDGTLAKDTIVVRVEGVKGKKVVRTEVKTRDGTEVSRMLVSEDVTVPPVNKIVAVGTKIVAQPKATAECDAHYIECVKKSDKDLDCNDIGHLVHVLVPGEDPHNFDADKDGIGCEKYPQLD